MSRGFLVAFAAVLVCACAYEDPEIDPAETAHDEDSATEVIGELGHPLHMRCVTSEKPVRFVIWKRGNRTNMWLHNNSVYGMTGNAFLIKSLAIETLGQYTCQAYSSDGFEAPRVFNVRAYRPDGLISGDDWLVPRDAVTITPDTTEALGESTTERPEVAASEGGIATLRCQFDSMKFHRDPSTKIKWKFGEREIDGTRGRYRVTSDGALQIVSLYRNDTGVYSCEPDNALGEASHDIHLIVNDPVSIPAGIAGEDNATITAELNQPLHVRCLPYGYPNPSVIWTRDDGVSIVLYNNSIYEVTETVLVIRSLILDALGPYTCRAYNEAGRMASWEVVVQAYRPEGLLIQNEWLVPRDTIAPTPIPITQPSITTDIWPFTDKVYNCDKYLVNCSRLRCEYGIQRTRQHDGCEQCSCVQVEIDCEPLQQECTQLKCNYGIERVTGSDGCERCKCKEHPCERKSCAAGERCVVLSYKDGIHPEPQFTTECRTIVKAGACPMDETATDEDTCHRECADDAHCRGAAKCCRRGCSDVCLAPVEQTSPRPLLTTTTASNPEQLLPPDCTPYQQECETLDCPYGVDRFTQDECQRCVCSEDPCIRANCQPTERCEAAALWNPASQEPEYFAKCVYENTEVHQCDEYVANCSRLRCEYGIQRTRQQHGCEQCSCVQVESDCEPLQQECTQLQCRYGIERVTEPDGCERCKCKEHPCKWKFCAVGERCVVQQYVLPGFQPERQFTTECRTIVKAGSCPIDETTTNAVTCRMVCRDDADCRGQAKCCRRGCSDVCLAPVEQTSPRPLLTTTIASNPDQLLPPDCTPYQQECEALDCPYGVDRFTQDECQSEDPCIRANCQPTERCEAAALWNPASQEPEYFAKCVYENTEVHQCDEYVANCSRLRCEYGIQRTRQQHGCEQCSCVQVESDCEPLQQECTQLQCRYGIERVTEPDGCERCKCKEDPCKWKSCAVGERCVVQQYVLLGFRPERQFKTECRTIVKAGACPMNETTTDEDKCRRECADDAHCRGEAKCCRRGCSDVCLAPVEQTSPRPLLTTTITSNPDQLLPPDCTPYQQECEALDCPYGVDRFTQDECQKCVCSEDPCKRANCQPTERCEAAALWNPASQEPEYFAKCVYENTEVHQCDEYVANCSRLRCEYGIQRTRQQHGCEQCSCVQVESDCEPLQQECTQLQCRYGIERVTEPDGCERCKCKEHPCKWKFCAVGERCVVQQYVLPGFQPERQFTTECRTIVKAGACPMDETTTNEVTCRMVCRDDADCRGEAKCCRRGCSDVCLAPVEQTSQRPLLTTTITSKNTEVHQCDEYVANCSRLRCEYGIQRTRQHDGCKQCSCVQVESDCEPLQQECTQLQCRYGIERVTEPDGCERCKCKEHPCKWKFCAVGERCVVQQYVLPGFQPERQFTTECRTIVKAGACPMDETTTNEVTCRMVCRDDADCRGEDKCCRRGCSDVCLAPVQQTSPRPNPVKQPVRIRGDQNAAVIGELGQPLPVHCLADGNPPPAVFWYFGYEENMVPYYNVDYLARGSVLLFRNLTIKNLGWYTCHAYNGEDKAATWSVIVRAYMPEGLFIDNEFVVPRTQTFTAAEITTKTLSTKKPFSLLLILPVTAHVSTPFSILNIGTDLHMICEIDGSPVPEVNWTKDGANIPSDPRITVTAGGTGVSRLTVTRVTVADSGLYACHASNPYSSQSDTVRINVQKLIAPAECTDDDPLNFCALVVRSKFCRAKNYPKSCCKSCVEAGELDALDLYQGLT
ncbi:hypothetical protein PYW07_008089 [Mythimna separata]|uniref:Hemolin n=1 Tax=Mythimna separata TaxID=271217 RepID=A0AAD7YS62_MYTSE|nr:hypothetical protein PYW07_008089 [Mythimna separata]